MMITKCENVELGKKNQKKLKRTDAINALN